MTRDDRDRFVIAPHHPDRLRRPGVRLGSSNERFHQALLWNIFRTLELVAPSFWLRRFHVRLTGTPPPVPAQVVGVQLWRHLPLPQIQRIDGERPVVVADLVIETEHAVWTVIAESAGRDVLDSEAAAAVVDAGAWFAGVRQHHCGLIESEQRTTSLGSVLQTRYSRSQQGARLRSATRGDAVPTHVGWGDIRWSDLASVVKDCSEAASLPPVERALAQNVLDWLTRVGVHPRPTEI